MRKPCKIPGGIGENIHLAPLLRLRSSARRLSSKVVRTLCHTAQTNLHTDTTCVGHLSFALHENQHVMCALLSHITTSRLYHCIPCSEMEKLDTYSVETPLHKPTPEKKVATHSSPSRLKGFTTRRHKHVEDHLRVTRGLLLLTGGLEPGSTAGLRPCLGQSRRSGKFNRQSR